MDTYEILTILQIPGKDSKILQRSYLNVEYETDDRESFVYTRTRKLGKLAGAIAGAIENVKV